MSHKTNRVLSVYFLIFYCELSKSARSFGNTSIHHSRGYCHYTLTRIVVFVVLFREPKVFPSCCTAIASWSYCCWFFELILMKDVTHRRLRANPPLDIGESKQTNKQTNQPTNKPKRLGGSHDSGATKWKWWWDHAWMVSDKRKLGDSCIVVFDPRQLFFVFK